MEIFKRFDAIEGLLLDLDIPRFEFLYEHKQGIGPYDPEFFEKSHARRKDREAKAKQALHDMTTRRKDFWKGAVWESVKEHVLNKNSLIWQGKEEKNSLLKRLIQ